MNKFIFILIIVTSLFFNIGCSTKDKKTTTNFDVEKKKNIEIQNTWMTPAAKNRNSSVYFTIINNSDNTDTLFGAISNLSQITELHETYERTEDILGMRTIKHVIVPANSTFNFSPGGFHVMLVGLITNLPIDASGEITLKFKTAGTVTIPVVCKVTEN